MKHEPSIPGSGLALGTGQGVLLARLRMQKHREVLADGLKARLDQLFWPGTDNDPVTISTLEAEQGVPNGSAHHVNLGPGE